MDYAFGVKSKESFINQSSQKILICFLLEAVLDLGFTLKYIIHFEFIFVYGTGMNQSWFPPYR